jgi:hypothetical protein
MTDDKVNPPALRSELWITLRKTGERGLIEGSCHTFPGRFRVWFESAGLAQCVSKNEVDQASPQSWYWIEGFLYGSVPRPQHEPEDLEAERTWLEKRRIFLETGEWSDSWEQLVKDLPYEFDDPDDEP